MPAKKSKGKKSSSRKNAHTHHFVIVSLVLVLCLVATFSVVQAQFQPLIQSILVRAQGGEQKISVKATQYVTQDGNKKDSGTWFGNASSADQSYAGILFENITLPKDAVITNLDLKMTSLQDQWISQKTTIYVEKNGKPEKFSSTNLPSQRQLSTRSVDYGDNTKWEKDKQYALPNLKALTESLQTSDSMSIALILKGTGGSWGRKFVYGTGDKAPELTITYTVPTATSTPVPTSSTTPTATPTSTPTSGGGTPTPTMTPMPSGMPMPGDGANPGGPGTTHPDEPGIVDSAMMGLWTPSKWDTCPKELHDSYYVIAPDGKRYPTWHPPTVVNPATGKTCTFGHEHGRDPKGSDLYSWIQEQNAYDINHDGTISAAEKAKSGIPFGYVNEQLDVYNTANNITNGMRHEDHVGNKIMWENNVQRDQSMVAGGSQRQPIDLYCDMLMAQHQGTHSADAFTNNVHATSYYIDCNQGSLAGQYPAKLALQFMSVFGKPGGFSEGGFAGGFNFIQVGTANPPNSPSAGEPGRSLPTINRVNQYVLVPQGRFSSFSEGLYEDWISGSYIKSASGKLLAYVDPHFAVFGPSRFYDPSQPGNLRRSIDVCYMKEANGDRARGGECGEVTNYRDGSTIPVDQRITYDDPRSPFNGCKREFYFNNNMVDNQGGPTYWYTDPYGKNGSTQPFPGSIRQYIASAKTSLPYPLESIALGKDIDWCGTGVHAPN